MAVMRAEINSTVTNGPYTYEFAVDGSVQKADINLTLAQCLDAVKALVSAQGGTVQHVMITVQSA